MRAAAVLAAAALALLPGCGGSDKKASARGLTGAQAQALLSRVQTIRAAAAAHDLQTTQSRLSDFDREVAQLRSAGALDPQTAASLHVGAARAAARAATELAPPPQPAAPAPTTPTMPPAYQQGDGGNGGGGGD
jgi:hypothetical protein